MTSPHPAPPVALTIAGSDCSAGAGLQADLKTFQHFQVHGLTAATCVVSETPKVVEAVKTLPASFVESQVRLLLDSYPLTAIKTGMLHSRAVIERVAKCLAPHATIPLVVDPVMMASSGAPLIEEDAVEAYREFLFPCATLLTPNLHEAEALIGGKITGLQAMEEAARSMSRDTGAAVLVKGGHLGGKDCIDILAEGDQITRYSHPRLPDADTHGTGCTLAAAIAAGLAHGKPLRDAVAKAGDYLAAALASRYQFEGPKGIQALNQGTLPKSLDSA
ncbi:MAG: bifunctional hydroxymethylpyrimidine kinase/phosphomethylpyrimidine kinase [Akkermansiaceae bacterium]|nr:bifunctional hydroxymethylpyrimidine kinase/phosphomethylpyrimidine kinase [Akkermansiaceae bacterium]